MADLDSENGLYGLPQVLRWQSESPIVKRSKKDDQEKAKDATTLTEMAEEHLKELVIEVTQQELDEVVDLKKQILLDQQSVDMKVLHTCNFLTH